MARRSFTALTAAMILLTLLTACSGYRRAGTGDIAFRLVWNGISDLDLYVQDPAGTCVFFGHRKSPTGAILDVDCNAGTDQICRHPIENVYWPTSTAPAGTYTYWVHANSLLLTEAPVAFELQLLRGEEVVWRRAGEIRAQDQTFGPFAYPFGMGGSATPIETGGAAPCTAWDVIKAEMARPKKLP